MTVPICFEDKEAPNRIVELLAKAGDRLDGAVNIHTTGQGDPADVVFLSYEAMFSCVRALVYAKGYREFGLRCLLLACDGLYVRTGQLDAEHLRKFEQIQRLKMSPRRGRRGVVRVRQANAGIAGAIAGASSVPQGRPVFSISELSQRNWKIEVERTPRLGDTLLLSSCGKREGLSNGARCGTSICQSVEDR